MADEEMDALAALADPRRRAVYELVAAAGEDVSRDQVAEALGIGRTLAAHHLDKLAEAGLLDVAFARLGGRSGPGAGRPSKLYRRSAAEHSVSLPPRGYRVLAEVFAEAVSEAGVEPALYSAARRAGARIARAALSSSSSSSAVSGSAAVSSSAVVSGSSAALEPAVVSGAAAGSVGDGVEAMLRGLGYEPYADGEVWRLRNCPFDSVARTHPGVVCGANLALLQGALGEGVRIDPGPSGCCVVVDRTRPGAGAAGLESAPGAGLDAELMSGSGSGTKNNDDLF
ncbi:helix-turn-helix transcriptional regulator [Dactylosporangium sp. NPDC051541]|uniref:helix-turn-helix transcriptional regulator n=1 Tax=Dactylosporangium sp. NPDC051541 TaxID=3363977 RepID=UPI003794F44F